MNFVYIFKNRFEDSLKMTLFTRFKTNDPYWDTIFSTCLLSIIGYGVNYLYEKNACWNIMLWNGMRWEDFLYFFCRKNSIVIEGKKSSMTTAYNSSYTVVATYSDRFKAIWHHIISNIAKNPSIYEIKESYSNCKTATYNGESGMSVSDLFIVSQKRSFLIDENIYACAMFENESEKENRGQDKSEVKIDKITIQIYSYQYSMSELIQYVDRITNEYILKIKKERKNKKFIYQLEKTKCDESVFECWSEFPFESSRNFRNLFFSGKQQIVNKIHFFLENREWYESKGIPYTLGIGLYGPPGTGKTSFIKALANETGRHLVILSTKLLKTRRDLNRFYFEMRYNTLNEKDQITFDKKIIVFEDIDCIGDIVLNREEVQKKIDLSSSCGHSSQELITETSMVVGKILKNMDKAESGPLVSSLMNKDDEPITLDDILNLWDGIRETPGRILIITSNHYDKLDPALIRPGRIDITHELRNSTQENISDIYQHLFGNKIDTELLEKVQEDFYSPADLVNLYISHKNEDDYLRRLLENRK